MTVGEREAFERLAREAGFDDESLSWVLGVYDDARTIARAEEMRREAFWSGLEEGVITAAVPELDRDVHDLTGLAEVADILNSKSETGTR
jgi:hypothetical protein